MSDLRVGGINGFCCGGSGDFFFPGLCALSLGFNTENDYVPVGLTSQGINVWIHVPVSQFGSSIC